MPLSITYAGRGAAALAARYNTLPDRVVRALEAGARRGAADALRYLRRVCPRLTGRLVRSLRVDVHVDATGAVSVSLRYLDYFDYQRGVGGWKSRAVTIVRQRIRQYVARVLGEGGA